MTNENDTSKPETELKQETGEGCPEATCSASDRQIRYLENQIAHRSGVNVDLNLRLHEATCERDDLLSDLKCALDWIADGDQEGRDLIAAPLRAKYFSLENECNRLP